MFIAPSNARPAPGVLEAITEADAIIIGPGNLFTDVIPNLLIKNISKTIKESKAIKIYIGNIMTKPGETDDFSLSDHIKAIFEHANNKIIDYCIYDTGEVVPEFVRRYNKDGADLVEQGITKKENDTEGSYIMNPVTNEAMDNNVIGIYLKNKRATAFYVETNTDLKDACDTVAVSDRPTTKCN